MSIQSPTRARTERLIAAVAAKLRSQAETLDQSKGAVKMTAHPRDDNFVVEIDVKL